MDPKTIIKIFRDIWMTGSGGYIGAAFGLVGTGNMVWSGAWLLIMIVVFLSFFLVYLADSWIEKNENKK